MEPEYPYDRVVSLIKLYADYRGQFSDNDGTTGDRGIYDGVFNERDDALIVSTIKGDMRVISPWPFVTGLERRMRWIKLKSDCIDGKCYGIFEYQGQDHILTRLIMYSGDRYMIRKRGCICPFRVRDIVMDKHKRLWMIPADPNREFNIAFVTKCSRSRRTQQRSGTFERTKYTDPHEATLPMNVCTITYDRTTDRVIVVGSDKTSPSHVIIIKIRFNDTTDKIDIVYEGRISNFNGSISSSCVLADGSLWIVDSYGNVCVHSESSECVIYEHGLDMHRDLGIQPRESIFNLTCDIKRNIVYLIGNGMLASIRRYTGPDDEIATIDSAIDKDNCTKLKRYSAPRSHIDIKLLGRSPYDRTSI